MTSETSTTELELDQIVKQAAGYEVGILVKHFHEWSEWFAALLNRMVAYISNFWGLRVCCYLIKMLKQNLTSPGGELEPYLIEIVSKIQRMRGVLVLTMQRSMLVTSCWFLQGLTFGVLQDILQQLRHSEGRLQHLVFNGIAQDYQRSHHIGTSTSHSKHGRFFCNRIVGYWRTFLEGEIHPLLPVWSIQSYQYCRTQQCLWIRCCISGFPDA